MRNYQAMERVKEFIGDQEYFTTRQAGTILGVSKAQVQRWIADGKLNIGEHKKASHIKIAQYDLLHFIAENHYEEYVLNLPNSFTVPELCKKVGLTRKWYYESLGEDKVAQPLHSPIRMKRIKYEDVRRIYENNANDLSKRERADFLKKLEAAYNVKVKNTQVCAGVTKIVMGGNGKDHPDYSLDMEEGVTDEGIPDNETGGVPDVPENEDGLIKDKKGDCDEILDKSQDAAFIGVGVDVLKTDTGEDVARKVNEIVGDCDGPKPGNSPVEIAKKVCESIDIMDVDMTKKVCADFMNESEEEVKASVGIARFDHPKPGGAPLKHEIDLTHLIPKFKHPAFENTSPICEELSLKSVLIETGIKLRDVLIRELNRVSISSLKQDQLWDFYNHLMSSAQHMEEFNDYINR